MPNFTVNITNASASADGQAATYIVDQENARRAALDPPLDPLPKSTNQELLNSYEAVLGQILASAHESYVKKAAETSLQEAKSRWEISSDAQRAAAVAELQPLP